MITKDDTLFLRGKGKEDQVKARVEQIKDQVGNRILKNTFCFPFMWEINVTYYPASCPIWPTVQLCAGKLIEAE